MLVKITQSVGQGGANVKRDVLLVQKLLNTQNILEATNPLKEDGIVGKHTIARIELFQKQMVKMLRPDGRIDPKGKTLELLCLSGVRSQIIARSNSGLNFSTKGINLLKSIEDLALKPYDDQTGREITVWVKGATIGYGHLIPKAEWGRYKDGITEVAASLLFNKDLLPFIQIVKSKVTASLTQNEFDAVVIFAFNIGASNFAASSVLKLLNDPDASCAYLNLESAWKAWNKSQGKEMRGLNHRRNAEWNIYSKNIYKKW